MLRTGKEEEAEKLLYSLGLRWHLETIKKILEALRAREREEEA